MNPNIKKYFGWKAFVNLFTNETRVDDKTGNILPVTEVKEIIISILKKEANPGLLTSYGVNATYTVVYGYTEIPLKIDSIDYPIIIESLYHNQKNKLYVLDNTQYIKPQKKILGYSFMGYITD